MVSRRWVGRRKSGWAQEVWARCKSRKGRCGVVDPVQSIVERSVTAMGYELVEIEHAQGGQLRVFIDAAAGIKLEDCETVSRQLSHLLFVEEVDYSRLEVSSPGLDRPLRKPADFERFAGVRVTVKLKRPFEGRRHFEGMLTVEPEGRFGLELIGDAQLQQEAARGKGGQPRSPSKRPAKQAATQPEVARKLVFALDEIDRARLVPEVKF